MLVDLQVDSAKKHGILLEMVQVLTDLDLVISKSYSSSDGGWFMDGEILVEFVLHKFEALSATRRGGLSKEIQGSSQRKHFGPHHMSSEHTVLEMTGTDRPVLLSEMSAVLAELACHIATVVVWTHHTQAACLFYVEDRVKGGLMFADKDYEQCRRCWSSGWGVVAPETVSSEGSLGSQEYYIRHQDGCTLDSETKKRKLTQCLLAAAERRASHGLRLEVSTQNRPGLLSDVTRVFRENGLSITRAEVGIHGERAIGPFYVTETSANNVNLSTVELVRKEIGDRSRS
ncbi:hypothetical protein NL676_022791 [Syzygium grande]|nr:hypothetical protein NL676_022791 [Syzygium grande]